MKLLLLLAVLLVAAPASAGGRIIDVTAIGAGPALVLVPGLGCDAEVWRDTVERYKKTHTVHVVTFAGFAGRPAGDAGPFLSRAAAELTAYIREQRLVRPVVVGHSVGGVVALQMAIDGPGLLGGIVILDALPFLPAAGDPKMTAERARAQADAVRAMLAAATPEAWAAQNRAALAAMITAPADVERIAATSSRSSPATIAQAVADLMTTDLRRGLGHVKTPTLVLAAAAGGRPAEVRAVYQAQYDRLRGHTLHVAERARHFIMLDDPGFFFAELDAFLGRVAS